MDRGQSEQQSQAGQRVLITVAAVMILMTAKLQATRSELLA